MKEAVIELFQRIFAERPRYVVRSPGRVNLIGEHTDYNDGFVLPLAIGPAVWYAFSPAPGSRVTLYADDFQETATFEPGRLQRSRTGWLEYIKGVAHILNEAGYQPAGWKGCIMSDLPIGAGLSSSAALETGAIAAFAAVSDLALSAAETAKLAQRAENEWVGMNCGIMDQMASAGGVADSALLIDCRSLELQPVLLPQDCMVAILDTSSRRKLVESQYNSRREQCEAAARFFSVSSLRELSLEQLTETPEQPDPTTYHRALHVVSENRRVLECADHLKEGNTRQAGRLLVESHESLRDLYEVSSPALDRIVEAALESRGCYGARMTGAGFGGCAVAMVCRDAVEQFSEDLKKGYHAGSGLTAAVYITRATNGTELIDVG